MTYWPLITEIISLLLIMILIFNLKVGRYACTGAVKLYQACLGFSVLSIVWNIICVILLNQGSLVSPGINMFMNIVYYIIMVAVCSATAFYIFEKMLEHVYDEHCICRAKRVLTSLTAAFCIFAIANVKTGLLFWFDENGVYQRGILNWSGYGIMLVELILLFVCFSRHHASVSKEMKHAIKTFPVVVMILVITQLYDQSLLLNGTAVAFVDTILFISLYSQRRESDNVTGIGNRESFFSELQLRIAGKQKFQIVLLVLTDFSTINQRYGHQSGNEFLYSIASWIEKQYKEAVAFRYIGVTCAVVLPYSDREKSARYVREFQKRFEKSWTVGEYEEILPVSVCEMIFEDHNLEANQTIEILDYMLSIAKHSHQKYMQFDDTVAMAFLRWRKIVSRLRQAVKEDLFEVWYQPVYCRHSQTFCAAEALIRMKDEDGSFISPEEFIPIAEETGMVNEIFWLGLERVCRFISENDLEGLRTISVNMSISQVEDPKFVEKVKKLLNQYGVAYGQIKFEITEWVISNDSPYAQEIIKQMVTEGFCFYLDDFGTGYSSFSTIADYDFESIKLDRELVLRVESDPRKSAMIKGIVELFHQLDIQVVAEGTETREQVETLTELGVDRFQGYYFAKPMSGDLVKEVMR